MCVCVCFSYCMRLMLHSVPPMWICEECRSSDETADSRANHQVEDNEAVHQNITSDSSNQLSESYSSPVGNETKSLLLNSVL